MHRWKAALVASAALLGMSSGCSMEAPAEASEPAAKLAMVTEPAREEAADEGANEAPDPVARPPRAVEVRAPAEPPPPTWIQLQGLSGPSGLPAAIPSASDGSDAIRRDVMAVAVADRDHLVVTLRPGDVFLETQDGGQTWASWRAEHAISHMGFDAPGTWWGLSDHDVDGSAHRLARSRDGARTWELRTTGRNMEPLYPRGLTITDRLIAAPVGRFILASKRGKKWVWHHPGFPKTVKATSVTFDAPGRSGKMMVAGERGWIAFETGEDSWSTSQIAELGRHHQVTRVVRALDDQGTAYAATTAGLYRQLGEGWSRVEELGRRSLRGVRFFGGGRGLAFGDASELWGTRDHGRSWAPLSAGARDVLGFPEKTARSRADHVWRDARPFGDGAVVVGDNGAILAVGWKQN